MVFKLSGIKRFTLAASILPLMAFGQTEQFGVLELEYKEDCNLERELEEEHKDFCEVMRRAKEEFSSIPVLPRLEPRTDRWKLKFYFSFARTNIRPTDMDLESTLITDTIRGFRFDERTSASHYNPKNWKEIQDSLRWIDEPSNTMALCLENSKHIFCFTAFHPKFLQTHYIMKSVDESGHETVSYEPSETYLSYGTEASYNSIPEGMAAFEVQNTHKLMNFQIGYGRKFALWKNRRFGAVHYIPKVDIGITAGAARSIYIDENRGWIENTDRYGVQGFNASIGHKLEYTRGDLGIFLQHMYTTSKIGHEFLDGKASYKLDYSTLNFGVSVKLFNVTKNKKQSSNRNYINVE